MVNCDLLYCLHCEDGCVPVCAGDHDSEGELVAILFGILWVIVIGILCSIGLCLVFCNGCQSMCRHCSCVDAESSAWCALLCRNWNASSRRQSGDNQEVELYPMRLDTQVCVCVYE